MGHNHNSKPSNLKRVLFLGGGKRLSLLERFESAATKEGLELQFFCYELRPEVHIGQKATVIQGKPFSEFYVHDLDILCNEHKIDLVVPLMDAAVPVCSLYKQMNPDTYMAVPEYETARACYDKRLFEEWCKQNGVNHYPHFKKLPGFAKKRFGYGSRDQHIVKTKRQLQDAYDNGYIVQKYIPYDVEYTVDCYVNQRGGVVGCVPRARLLVSRGEVENSVTVIEPMLTVLTQSVIGGHGFSGPVTVQWLSFKGTQEYYLSEINARFGGGVILSIEAGADYPRLMLREMLGLPIEPVTYKPNLLMLRSYRETFYPNYSAG